ncbi:hypothetical protein [Cytobacillus depressus]|uniref:hypothetical protein n=1 Tax=Cytobacillus depressus TaxID=1602942 RepID=UPI001FE8B2C7|nr:hypothetical protein [Cytobacillus depressus]
MQEQNRPCAYALGFRFKHVASIHKTENGITCSVKPVLVNESHPFYQIEDVQNAASIDRDIVGNISLQGPGAGMFPTASAIIEDLVHINTMEIKRAHLANKASPDDQAVLSYWAIGGGVYASTLPTPIQVIERIHPNVLIVQAPEETIYAVHFPNVHIYQILGKVVKKEVLVIQ